MRCNVFSENRWKANACFNFVRHNRFGDYSSSNKHVFVPGQMRVRDGPSLSHTETAEEDSDHFADNMRKRRRHSKKGE